MISISKSGLVFRFLKGLIAAALVCMCLLLSLSLVASIFGAGEVVLRIFNIIVRIAAVAVFAFFLSDGNRGILKGLLAGAASFLLILALFSIFSGVKSIGALALDLLFSCIFGIIFGIIFANLKNKGDNT